MGDRKAWRGWAGVAERAEGNSRAAWVAGGLSFLLSFLRATFLPDLVAVSLGDLCAVAWHP